MLRELTELREGGVVTDADFERLRTLCLAEPNPPAG